MKNRLVKYISDPDYRFSVNQLFGFYDKMPDKPFLMLMFKHIMGYELPIENPVTFNEKIQWLKLNDRKPQYAIMADKVEAKKYVASVLGEEVIIPTIGVWDDASKIDFDQLPDRFVLKCNHNSGLGMYICSSKTQMDEKKVRSDLNRGLRQNFYLYGREWAYRDIPRRILAEQFLSDGSGEDIKDYKFFCFNGKCKVFKVDFDRFTEHRANYYDRNKKLLSLGEVVCPPNYEKEIILPDTIEKMIEYAELLSKDCFFLRVDFYDVNGRIYFGEMTFYPNSGFGAFTEDKWDKELGNWIELPIRKYCRDAFQVGEERNEKHRFNN